MRDSSRARWRCLNCPAASMAEVAFAGRSNAGKSSAINALLGRKRLAFVSRTPGRTQQLNYFDLGNHRYLVDLPGYGYARVAKSDQARWEELLPAYLADPHNAARGGDHHGHPPSRHGTGRASSANRRADRESHSRSPHQVRQAFARRSARYLARGTIGAGFAVSARNGSTFFQPLRRRVG